MQLFNHFFILSSFDELHYGKFVSLYMKGILAMIDRVKPPPTYCLLWFDKISGPIVSQATYTYGWYSKWGNYKDGLLQPYKTTPAPDSISLVESKCQKPRNNLRVYNNRPEVKQDFAVCVKGLDFLHEDLSVRLIEWIELLKILGAKKIFLYEMEIHSNISKVLHYYQIQGIVELTPIKPLRLGQNELKSYNDCLYRNLYSYSYLVLLDINEVIKKNYSRASYNIKLSDQPNLPGFRHLYLKNKLTAKRQNELITWTPLVIWLDSMEIMPSMKLVKSIMKMSLMIIRTLRAVPAVFGSLSIPVIYNKNLGKIGNSCENFTTKIQIETEMFRVTCEL
uniref:Glycosyltransferase family 92 protein n=1 Tax=Tetranychus urticae TaxID=32264 RepID=T1K341_TETUR